ncbi:hypothetical protein GEMRC1_002668 [Eukaryota sp. GEM-RC1]
MVTSRSLNTSTKSSSAVLSPTDLDAIRSRALQDTSSDVVEKRRRRLENYQRQQSRISKLRATPDINKPDLNASSTTDPIKSKAKILKTEEQETAKQLESMALFAKKTNAASETKEEQARLDAVMEQDRLLAIQREKEKEVVQKEQTLKGAEIIRQQKKDREQQRLLEEELLEKEKKAALDHIQLLKREEEAERDRKIQESMKLRVELNTVNQQLSRKKGIELEQAKHEDLAVLEYQRKKAEKEEKRLEEQRRIAQQKEQEINKLRAQQEKARDKQAQLDELRARRAMEAADRKARERELNEAKKRQRLQKELSEARTNQLMEKEARLTSLIEEEQSEFERIAKEQQAERRRLIEEEKRFATKCQSHQQDLLSQIHDQRDRYQKEQKVRMLEGAALMKKRAEEKAEIQALQEMKILELEKQGVPAKYLLPLKSMKI